MPDDKPDPLDALAESQNGWEYEDELDCDITPGMYAASELRGGVRMYPYIERTVRHYIGEENPLDLALRLDINPQTVSRWERGECEPGSIEMLRRIAAALKISVKDLVCD